MARDTFIITDNNWRYIDGISTVYRRYWWYIDGTQQ